MSNNIKPFNSGHGLEAFNQRVASYYMRRTVYPYGTRFKEVGDDTLITLPECSLTVEAYYEALDFCARRFFRPFSGHLKPLFGGDDETETFQVVNEFLDWALQGLQRNELELDDVRLAYYQLRGHFGFVVSNEYKLDAKTLRHTLGFDLFDLMNKEIPLSFSFLVDYAEHEVSLLKHVFKVTSIATLDGWEEDQTCEHHPLIRFEAKLYHPSVEYKERPWWLALGENRDWVDYCARAFSDYIEEHDRAHLKDWPLAVKYFSTYMENVGKSRITFLPSDAIIIYQFKLPENCEVSYEGTETSFIIHAAERAEGYLMGGTSYDDALEDLVVQEVFDLEAGAFYTIVK